MLSSTTRSVAVTAAFAIVTTVSPAPAQRLTDKPLVRPADVTKDYKYTADRFKGRISYWTSDLAEFKDRPVRYLEIGVFEGRSLFWMIDNILTHPDSELYALDTFGWSYFRLYQHNLEISGAEDRVKTLKGYAEQVMMGLERDSFDLIFIDNGHHARSVYMQTGLAWQLLKEGGILIFDDYRLNDDEWPLDMRPEVAIDAFLTSFGEDLEIMRKGREVWVRKSPALPDCYYCSRFFDGWVYEWLEEKLMTLEDRTEVELSDAERKVVESLYLEREYPEIGMALTGKVLADPAFKSLQKRLGFEVPEASSPTPE